MKRANCRKAKIRRCTEDLANSLAKEQTAQKQKSADAQKKQSRTVVPTGKLHKSNNSQIDYTEILRTVCRLSAGTSMYVCRLLHMPGICCMTAALRMLLHDCYVRMISHHPSLCFREETNQMIVYEHYTVDLSYVSLAL